MKCFTGEIGLSQAEYYSKNSSKKHQSTKYITKAHGNVYYVYDKLEDIDKGEKLIATFKNGEKI